MSTADPIKPTALLGYSFESNKLHFLVQLLSVAECISHLLSVHFESLRSFQSLRCYTNWQAFNFLMVSTNMCQKPTIATQYTLTSGAKRSFCGVSFRCFILLRQLDQRFKRHLWDLGKQIP